MPVLFLLTALFSFHNYKQFKSLKSYKLILALPIFWLIHIIGGLYSDNMSYWGLDIEVKLSFLVVPILFVLFSDRMRKYWYGLLMAFILGVLVKSIYLLYKAYDCLNYATERLCFESTVFAGDYHTSYIATLFLIAILSAWVLYIKKFKHWAVLILVGIFTSYSFYFIYQFYAIGPWISLAMMMFISIFYWVPKKIWWAYPIIIGVLSFSLFYVVKNMDLTASGYNAVQKEFSAFNQDPKQYLEDNKNDTQSIKARILLWYVSMQIIKDKPIGVGNGDTKDILIQKYRTFEMTNYAEKKLNPHNQYLQTTIALGWFTGLYLIFLGFYCTYLAFRERHFLLLGVAVIFFSGMAFESMLENQAGVIPFAVFFSFIFATFEFYKSKEKN